MMQPVVRGVEDVVLWDEEEKKDACGEGRRLQLKISVEKVNHHHETRAEHRLGDYRYIHILLEISEIFVEFMQ